MDYENLKIQMKEIVEITAGVPDNLKEKCFEILLDRLILSNLGQVGGSGNLVTQHRDETNTHAGEARRFSGHLQAFMRETSITREDIDKVLFIDGEKVHFISEPGTMRKTQGVIQWALLVALENTFTSEKGELRVDPEKLRSICQEKGYYDPPNFAKTLKTKNNDPLFGGTLEPQGDPRMLTSKGREMLGELIRELGTKK